ncbi:hypothetical protein Shyd_88340 [Streptomyces hydrogenans]|uniref:Uncharacterized protein n=1 Tax=Streptomyces hydrogenans TaxID=1873719 RepID=A0ABQ3PR16_9ACTN|nr:hypothetical protein GCM10018784_08620 [Streptomyces hydrogenans]GHI27463.1 hypothetical protein Shyd_88340 [Streptomyces hydrogenans]
MSTAAATVTAVYQAGSVGQEGSWRRAHGVGPTGGRVVAGDECRVDRRGVEALDDRGRESGAPGTVDQGEDGDETGPARRARDDERFAVDAVGQVARGDPADAPEDRVRAPGEADSGETLRGLHQAVQDAGSGRR